MTQNDPIRAEIMRAADAASVAPQKAAMAYDVFTALLLDLPLTPAQTVDFGVSTPDHYRAMRDAITGEVNAATATDSAPESDAGVTATILGLARRLGDGPALTTWAQTYWPDAPAFTTPYDLFNIAEADEPEYPYDDERRPHP